MSQASLIWENRQAFASQRAINDDFNHRQELIELQNAAKILRQQSKIEQLTREIEEEKKEREEAMRKMEEENKEREEAMREKIREMEESNKEREEENKNLLVRI